MIWLARAGTPVATTLQPLEPVELRVLHVVAPTLELDGEAVRTVSACLEDDEVRRAQGGRGEEAKATTPRCRRHANGLGVEVQDGIVVAVQLSPRDELLVRLLVRLAIVRAARSLPRRLHRDRRGGIDGRPAPARLKPRPDHRFFYGELPSRLRREHTPSRPLRGRNQTLEDLHIPANLLVLFTGETLLEQDPASETLCSRVGDDDRGFRRRSRFFCRGRRSCRRRHAERSRRSYSARVRARALIWRSGRATVAVAAVVTAGVAVDHRVF